MHRLGQNGVLKGNNEQDLSDEQTSSSGEDSTYTRENCVAFIQRRLHSRRRDGKRGKRNPGMPARNIIASRITATAKGDNSRYATARPPAKREITCREREGR